MKDWIHEEFLIFIIINFSVLRSKSIFLKIEVLLLLLFCHPLLFTALSTSITVIFRTVVDLYKTYLRSIDVRL